MSDKPESRMRSRCVHMLLAALNSRLLNQTPCAYGFIGNVDAFSASHLEYEERERPGITVRTILDEAAIWKTCPMRTSGLTVIENGEVRDGTIWDEHELREHFTRAGSDKENIHGQD